jgi:hypothetical protein
MSIPIGDRYPPSDLTSQKRTLHAQVAQVDGLAPRQPVLMVWEDLHWCDPTTRELLDLLIGAAIPVLPPRRGSVRRRKTIVRACGGLEISADSRHEKRGNTGYPDRRMARSVNARGLIKIEQQLSNRPFVLGAKSHDR